MSTKKPTGTAPKSGTNPSQSGKTRLTGEILALLATLVLAVLAFQLNASMVTPALPHIARVFEVGDGTVGQVSSIFFLAGAVAGVILTRWSDFIGRKRTLMIVLTILAIGTLVCIFAVNFPMLLVGRFLQGTSGAIFQLVYMILREATNEATFASVIGVITAINGGVAGIDAWVGGWLTEQFGFRSLFIVILCAIVAAIVAAQLVVKERPLEEVTGTMDWAGGAVMAVALILITYYFNFAGTDGWFAPIPRLLLAGTVAAFVVFYFIEKRSSSPMFSIDLLKSRTTWPLIATTLLCLASVFAVINFIVTILAQNFNVGFGLSADVAALLYLTPPALIGLVAAPVSGYLSGKIGWFVVLRGGIILSMVAILVIALFSSNQWIVFAMICILGATYNGMILTTINGLGVVLASSEAPGALPAFNGAAFGIGASLGIGIVAPYVGLGTSLGFTAALYIALGIAGLALVCSLILKARPGQTI
ncbi:MFS transporter [Corynebacterium hindlerae]|nr:MFS transporter [Corynebacterium hindlerae]